MCDATYLDSNSWLTLNIFGLWLGWMVFHGVAFSRDQTTEDATSAHDRDGGPLLRTVRSPRKARRVPGSASDRTAHDDVAIAIVEQQCFPSSPDNLHRNRLR